MNIAIVGCGFVADFYVKTAALHPELQVTGVTDRDAERLARFSAHHGVATYASLDDLLDDPRVDLVVDLTNPGSHYEVNRAALEAGKHVYSEKPLALAVDDARALVELAESRGLLLSCAPCSSLSEAAQTLAKAVREERVGPVRLVYAEMDDGLVHRKAYQSWVSESGTPWPWKNEFETGCTLEHAGYSVSWLVTAFGPAESVTAFSSCQIPDKETDVPLEVNAPDFSVACIRFASGVVARLTCSIIAPVDHSIRVFGDDGILQVDDCWKDRSPVHAKRWLRIRRRTFVSPWKNRVPLVGRGNPVARSQGAQRRDFCRGIADMAEALAEGRAPRLSARYCLHVAEIVLGIQNALASGSPWKIETSFDPVEPMPWAR